MRDRIDHQFGEYRLVRLIGRGGFADVYLGEHVRRKTLAAVKVLHDRIAQDNLKQFLNEARSFRLKHAHIVPLLDFGLEDDFPYLIMEYAAGGSLRKLHPKGAQLPLPLIVSYVKQVAEALQYAHDEGIVHRDIKPDNMLVGNNGEILLADFGITSVSHSTHSLDTQDHAGTIAYMAPEQLQGKPRAASDQYALGIVVYEWICGERPFSGTVVEIQGQHFSALPAPLSERVITLAPMVEKVVMTALSKDPHHRFASIRAFAIALEQAYQLVPSAASSFATQTPDQMFSTIVLSAPLSEQTPPRMLATASELAKSPTSVNDHFDENMVQQASPTKELTEQQTGQNSPSSTPLPLAVGVPSAYVGEEPIVMKTFIGTENPITPKEYGADASVLAHSSTIAPTSAASLTPIPSEMVQHLNDTNATKLVAFAPHTSRKKNKLFLITVIVLTLLFVASVLLIVFAGLANINPGVITTTLTITPNHQTVSDSFVVAAMTGKYDPTAQVQARIVSYTSPSQSASANSTGSIPGANAVGTLTFVNSGNGVQISGGILIGADGVQVSFNSFFLPFGSSSVQGIAVNQGTSGNIPALDINGSCCGDSNIGVRNTGSFSGGQDPVPNSVITQSDINSASNNLITTLKPSAQSALQQKVQANEQVVSGSLKCTSNVSPNHRVGDQAKSVTVTGTVTCTEETYDQKTALDIAINVLKAEAATNPGAGYALVGIVVTSITSATVVDTKNTVSLVILAQGAWVYQFTDAILNGIKNKVAKESQSAAQADLKKWQGVMSATVSISSGTMMTDAANITVNVVKIPGLTGSPTPGSGSPTTTPSGTTPTSSPAITPTTGLGNGATVTPTFTPSGS